jgi:hypothetical protein
LYIPFKSGHHPRQLNSYVYGECLRFARNSTRYDDYITTVHSFRAQLLARGYPPHAIDPNLFRFNYNDRPALFQARPARAPTVIPMILTFYKHWKLIQLVNTVHTHLRRLHPDLPRLVFAWTRARSLQSTLGAQW